jgi:hypothetical protein
MGMVRTTFFDTSQGDLAQRYFYQPEAALLAREAGRGQGTVGLAMVGTWVTSMGTARTTSFDTSQGDLALRYFYQPEAAFLGR